MMAAPMMLALVLQGNQLKTASHHSIQYYLSLPEGWRRDRKWPVVIGIESAEREFSPYFGALVKARGHKPFIIAVPLVVTNGGSRYRQGPGYRYSPSVWNQIDADPWKFDDDGMQAILKDLRARFGAEDKAFITGFEAGGHIVFAFTFRHPDLIRAAAPVSPNYAGRNVSFTKAQTYPPIRCFWG